MVRTLQLLIKFIESRRWGEGGRWEERLFRSHLCGRTFRSLESFDSGNLARCELLLCCRGGPTSVTDAALTCLQVSSWPAITRLVGSEESRQKAEDLSCTGSSNAELGGTSEWISQGAIKNSTLLSVFIYADITARRVPCQSCDTSGAENKGKLKEFSLSEHLTSEIGLSWQMSSINEGPPRSSI